MIDKVQKIREEVARLKLCTMDEHMKFYSECAEAEYNALCKVEEIIDSLQEEPVGKNIYLYFKAIPRLLDMIEPSKRAKFYINKLADSLDNEGYHVDANIARERVKIMDGEKIPLATMDEEPVSEELKEAANEAAEKAYPYIGGTKGMICESLKPIFIKGFKAGAKWQKQRLMKDAINATVWEDSGGYPYIDKTIDMYDYDKDIPLAKGGDKVKLIVVKE